jgi:hypothetical protein
MLVFVLYKELEEDLEEVEDENLKNGKFMRISGVSVTVSTKR